MATHHSGGHQWSQQPEMGNHNAGYQDAGYHDAPELVVFDYPQTVSVDHSTMEPTSAWPVEPKSTVITAAPDYSTLEPTTPHVPPPPSEVPWGEAPAPESRPWWRRRRTWIVGAAALLVVIGVVLGVVFGVALKKDDESIAQPLASNSPNSPDTSPTKDGDSPTTTGRSGTIPTGESSCKDSLCQPVLAAAVQPVKQSAGNSQPFLHLFARMADGTVRHTTSEPGGTSFEGSWTDRKGTIAVGAMSARFWEIQSVPSISIFGISGPNPPRNIVFQHLFLNGDGTATPQGDEYRILEQQGARFPVGAPTVCAYWGDPPARIDVWAKASEPGGEATGGVWHQRTEHAPEGSPPGSFSTGWTHIVVDHPATSGNAPGAICRDTNYRHDVVIYGNETGGGRAWNKQYVEARVGPTDGSAAGWGNWTEMGETQFKAGTGPVLLNSGPERTDFLGLGIDGAVHHWTWTAAAGGSQMESLGGRFASPPVATVGSVGGTTRIDVVAIADDGKLRYRYLQGSTWSSDWTDLGVDANSAPIIERVGERDLMLSIIAVDGTVWYAHARIKDDGDWDKLEWKEIPGVKL